MLPIIKLPNPKLRERSIEIDREFLLSKETQNLIKEMISTMCGADGVGLAAVQVGENIRICTIGKEAAPEKKNDLALINPRWSKISRKTVVDIEGCLSVPKKYGKVKRHKNIKVTALDASGNPLSFSASDMLARVIQHEVDHMDGVLFIDKAEEIQEVE